MNLKDLMKPVDEDHLEWRALRSGLKNGKPWAIVAPYIQSRAIMARLDEVCGQEGWQVQHTVEDKGIITSIGIYIGGEWIWKSDGAGFTDVESFKGGISDGLKRAGVPWGIGRYLYDLPTPMFAEFDDHGKYTAKIEGQYHKWNPPSLSKAPQKREKAPESRPDELEELRVILTSKMKQATDNGLFSTDDLVAKLRMFGDLQTVEAAQKTLDNLNAAIKKRGAEKQAEEDELTVI